MLTFFEYLRQRSFEAVVAGVHDAFEYLDSHKTFDNPKLSQGPNDRLSAKKNGLAQSPPAKAENSNTQQGSGATTSLSNPERKLQPRKRGRPRKPQGGHQ